MRKTAKNQKLIGSTAGGLKRLPALLLSLLLAILTITSLGFCQEAEAKSKSKKTAVKRAVRKSARKTIKSTGRKSGRGHTSTKRRASAPRRGPRRAAHSAYHKPVRRTWHSPIHEGPADSANFTDPEPRRRNYALIGQAYHLYDQGLNEHLVGNYGSALDKLTEASNLLDQARSNQRTGVPSTLEAMVFYEMGQTAEQDGDVRLARDSYAHCVKACPTFVEGYLRVSSLLAREGNLALAENFAREGEAICPGDARLAQLVNLIETKKSETKIPETEN